MAAVQTKPSIMKNRVSLAPRTDRTFESDLKSGLFRPRARLHKLIWSSWRSSFVLVFDRSDLGVEFEHNKEREKSAIKLF